MTDWYTSITQIDYEPVTPSQLLIVYRNIDFATHKKSSLKFGTWQHFTGSYPVVLSSGRHTYAWSGPRVVHSPAKWASWQLSAPDASVQNGAQEAAPTAHRRQLAVRTFGSAFAHCWVVARNWTLYRLRLWHDSHWTWLYFKILLNS